MRAPGSSPAGNVVAAAKGRHSRALLWLLLLCRRPCTLIPRARHVQPPPPPPPHTHTTHQNCRERLQCAGRILWRDVAVAAHRGLAADASQHLGVPSGSAHRLLTIRQADTVVLCSAPHVHNGKGGRPRRHQPQVAALCRWAAGGRGRAGVAGGGGGGGAPSAGQGACRASQRASISCLAPAPSTATDPPCSAPPACCLPPPPSSSPTGAPPRPSLTPPPHTHIRADQVHPAAATGHRYLSELLIHSLQLAASELLLEVAMGQAPQQLHPRGLPLPMLPGNEVRQHEQCYVQVCGRAGGARGRVVCDEAAWVGGRHQPLALRPTPAAAGGPPPPPLLTHAASLATGHAQRTGGEVTGVAVGR